MTSQPTTDFRLPGWKHIVRIRIHPWPREALVWAEENFGYRPFHTQLSVGDHAVAFDSAEDAAHFALVWL